MHVRVYKYTAALNLSTTGVKEFETFFFYSFSLQRCHEVVAQHRHLKRVGQ